MITVFKIFENIETIEIGDYVYINPNYGQNTILSDSNRGLNTIKFIINNIGKIIFINKYIKVKFYNIPYEYIRYFLKNSRLFSKKDIFVFAKTKEELELKLQSKNYNI